MKRSQSFLKTSKNAPADETSKNAQLLVRAGYVHKEMAGVYTYLPLGLRVLENISKIVREEMNAAGGQEMRLTTLQSSELWKKTDRWDDDKVDIWFKTDLKAGGQLGLGPTHEEPLTNLLKNFITSYKDLPFATYQIQTKFRNELRAKSGIMRGREFLMKDMYTFARTVEEHEKMYAEIQEAYKRVYDRLGIGDKTFMTFASGGMFTQFSHEYQTVTEAGEDNIYLDEAKKIAVNEEVMTDEVLNQLGLKRENMKQVKAAEVGNIFTLNDKFSKPMELQFVDEKGEKRNVLMGCYGIGISRCMGVITELLADEKGLVWPTAIAPYKVYLATIGDSEAVLSAADDLYESLGPDNALYDDRDLRPGEKFADAELLGIPFRVVVSEKSLAAGGFEVKTRTGLESEILDKDTLVNRLK
jgi:prolyl-tRNA synthetase